MKIVVIKRDCVGIPGLRFIGKAIADKFLNLFGLVVDLNVFVLD